MTSNQTKYLQVVTVLNKNATQVEFITLPIIASVCVTITKDIRNPSCLKGFTDKKASFYASSVVTSYVETIYHNLSELMM